MIEGEYESFKLTNITSGATIESVQMIWRCGIWSGTGSPERIDSYINISGTPYIDLSKEVLTDNSFVNMTGTNRTTSPATGSSWTVDEVNEMEAVVYSDTLDSEEEIRCSEAYIIVWYTYGNNSNLTVWDETDSGQPYGDKIRYLDQNVKFFTNYTNATDGNPITGVTDYCEISFNISGGWTVWENMTYNGTSKLYENVTQFSENDTYNWNVSCYSNDYDNLNSTDTVIILSLIHI